MTPTGAANPGMAKTAMAETAMAETAMAETAAAPATTPAPSQSGCIGRDARSKNRGDKAGCQKFACFSHGLPP
jgi:hypothetical protein